MVGSIRKFDCKDEGGDWICGLMGLAVGKLCLPLKACMAPLFVFCSFVLFR